MLKLIRAKQEARRLKAECAAGRHELSEGAGTVWARYVLCRRYFCTYSYENPDYNPVKAEWLRRKHRAVKKVQQTAGFFVCLAKGHDMVYGTGFDWWSYCKRCGK